MNYIAYQYAEALFSLSLEKNKVVDVLNEFIQFTSAMDNEIIDFINHPKISKKDKKDIIAKGVINDIFKRFTYVLIDNSRFDLLKDILVEFEKVVNKHNNLIKVKVFSNKKLSKEQLEKLNLNLSEKNNRKIELENVVDESIVGGLRVEYEGMIFDDTVNNYLSSLKANLKK